jgi:hypothetical protein
MISILQNFNYDTQRQGYDTNLWHTLAGAPFSDLNGRIQVGAGTGVAGAAVSYTDITKGDVSFDINVGTAPNVAFARYFGLSNASATQYVRFKIGENMTCQTSDGVTTTESPTIVWNSDWEGTNTFFKIVWQAGFVKFFINFVRVYQVADSSVPHGPLSLYLYDNSTDAMTIGNMVVRGSQSVIVNPKTSDHVVIISSSPSVSPSISVSPSASPSASPSVSPSASPSVSPSVSESPSASPSVSPSVSVSPSTSISPSISPSASESPSLSPSVSPSTSPSVSISPSKSPSVSVSPSVSASPSASPSVSPSL